jgi:hypothetical protein
MNSLKRFIASAFGAMAGLSLSRFFMDHPLTHLTLALVAGFIGFVAVSPKQFWDKYQEHLKAKKTAKAEAKKAYDDNMVTFGEVYALNNRLAVTRAICRTFLVFWIVALVVVLIQAVLTAYRYELTVAVVQAAVMVEFLVLYIAFVNWETPNKNNYDYFYPSSVPGRVEHLKCTLAYDKKKMFFVMILPVSLLIHLGKTLTMAGLIAAGICEIVATIHHYCAAIGAIIGYIVGTFTNNILLGMLVGGIVGESSYWVAKGFLWVLPNPEKTPVPQFIS